MPLPQPKIAFVAGCTGVSGNALVEYLIRQPKEEWSRIIVSSRSQPKNYWQDPRVEFLALDLLNPVDSIIQSMQPLCQEVTHAYFVAYVHTDDFAKLREMNVPLFENFLTSIDTVAGDSLQRVCLQTGGKHYGAHLGPRECPLHEELPRYEDRGENFYYPQEDFLFKLHAQRKWSWNVIRPNAIIGFTPGKNGMSEALTLALYMIICREMGEIPMFPGNKYFYNAVDDNSFAGGLADISVWATTHEHTKNEAFNHVNGDTFVWRYFFKKIGKYFGLDIPDQTEWPELGDQEKYAHSIKLGEWAKDKKPVWEAICDKYGGNKEAFDWGTWGFLDWTTGKGWPTVSTMTKARKFGWHRHDDTYETWVETYRSFENAGVLPRNHLLVSQRNPTKLANGTKH